MIYSSHTLTHVALLILISYNYIDNTDKNYYCFGACMDFRAPLIKYQVKILLYIHTYLSSSIVQVLLDFGVSFEKIYLFMYMCIEEDAQRFQIYHINKFRDLNT